MDVLLLLAVLYFVPALIAVSRRHQNTASIFVINLFLGWTFLGWVGALAWALTPVVPGATPIAFTRS